ncbi:MAG: hypothetical protein RL456_942 [Pseudomonadota bacterium]|jgi:phosphonoacetaldehyde hydrolase
MHGESGMPPATLGAVIFDWAGTVVDFGSHAPMGAFVRLFGRHGVQISIGEARAPMGLPKWDHIRALGRQPRIAAAWRAHHGHAFDDHAADRLHAEFTPMNVASVVDHAALIPGARETMARLRERGLRIGSTTGYTRPIMEVLAPLAAAQGFAPDNLVCAGDLPASRPSPMGVYRTLIDLDIWPAWRAVKVDDTVPGLMEGRHAGCWTVAVAATGNAMGLTLDEWATLDATEQARRLLHARRQLEAARPDAIIDSVADLPPVLDAIEALLRQGRRP